MPKPSKALHITSPTRTMVVSGIQLLRQVITGSKKAPPVAAKSVRLTNALPTKMTARSPPENRKRLVIELREEMGVSVIADLQDRLKTRPSYHSPTIMPPAGKRVIGVISWSAFRTLKASRLVKGTKRQMLKGPQRFNGRGCRHSMRSCYCE